MWSARRPQPIGVKGLEQLYQPAGHIGGQASLYVRIWLKNERIMQLPCASLGL